MKYYTQLFGNDQDEEGTEVCLWFGQVDTGRLGIMLDEGFLPESVEHTQQGQTIIVFRNRDMKTCCELLVTGGKTYLSQVYSETFHRDFAEGSVFLGQG